MNVVIAMAIVIILTKALPVSAAEYKLTLELTKVEPITNYLTYVFTGEEFSFDETQLKV